MQLAPRHKNQGVEIVPQSYQLVTQCVIVTCKLYHSVTMFDNNFKHCIKVFFLFPDWAITSWEMREPYCWLKLSNNVHR